MTTHARNTWPVVIVLGGVFTLVNVIELVFLDGRWPEIVGVPIGIALAIVGSRCGAAGRGCAADAG